jgi:hypothetical protein
MRPQHVALLTILATACGGASAQDLGPDIDAGQSSSSGGSVDGSSGGGGGGDKRDGSSGGRHDANPTSSDAGLNGLINDQITITDLLLECKQGPDVADPVRLKGSVTITNGTSSTIGPVTLASGSFLDPQTLSPIATFQLGIVQMPQLGPGQSSTVDIEKTPGSVSPALGCLTLPCNTPVIVEVQAKGPGIPPDMHIRTNPIQVVCAP